MFGTSYFASPSITTPFPDGLVDEVIRAPMATTPPAEPEAVVEATVVQTSPRTLARYRRTSRRN